MVKRLIQRTYHFLQRVNKESKNYLKNRKNFGSHIAKVIFKDGIIPPGKSESYLKEIENYVDGALHDFISNYELPVNNTDTYLKTDKIPVWVCWWQGEDAMPELVKMCYRRLHQIIPSDIAKIHLITLKNYKEYVTFPKHIIEKFDKKIITMTTLSDILRMSLLSEYGGVWIDSTVFFTDELPNEFFEKEFYSQKMQDTEVAKREASKSMWCGFCMAGHSSNPLFHFVRDAFSEWWKKYDDIVDYVLIDYLILEGYKNFPRIKELVDAVPNNNTGVFEMYKVLNQPYSAELYNKLTDNNVIHKLTYKIDLKKKTEYGQDTLYGYLLKDVYGDE